jgi:hypothetical protein
MDGEIGDKPRGAHRLPQSRVDAEWDQPHPFVGSGAVTRTRHRAPCSRPTRCRSSGAYLGSHSTMSQWAQVASADPFAIFRSTRGCPGPHPS